MEKILVLVEYQMTIFGNRQNWRLSNPDMNSSLKTKHDSCLKFQITPKSVEFEACSGNCQIMGNQLVLYLSSVTDNNHVTIPLPVPRHDGPSLASAGPPLPAIIGDGLLPSNERDSW